jgi:tricorn protease
MRSFVPFAPLALLFSAVLAQAAPQGFYRQPAIAGEQLVFVSQGDLWKVGAQGGAAQRLTSHGGQEAWPVLLPDGKTLAFVAQIDGAGDVYTMPLDGGPAQRRSWIASPQVRLWGFDPQGRLLLTAPALDGRPQQQAFRIDGDKLETLPVGDASDAAFSNDGSKLYFSRQGLRGDNAKNYRGGAIAQLWAMELAGQAEAKPLLGGLKANDRRPMPYRDAQGRDRIAFLSDRNGFVNLWSVAADGSDLRAHSEWKDFDLRHASLSGSTVVAARGADLLRIDLNAAPAAVPQPLPITLAGDHAAVATRWLKRPQDFLGGIAVAPNGERLALEVRGRVATQGTQALRRAQLQQGETASRCREPAYSSDSKSVFAFCDFSGEMEVWQLDALGTASPKRITTDGKLRRLQLSVSPDGRHVAHTDLGGALYLTDLKAEGGAKTRVIEQAGRRGNLQDLTWHPDGQALAYVMGVDQPAFRGRLWLHLLADGKNRPLTSDRYDSGEASFSPDGQWLYFASRRHFALQAGSSVWADRNMGPSFEPGEKVYALALQPGLRLPTTPKDELPEPAKPKAAEPPKPDAKADPKVAASAMEADSKKLPRIAIDGLEERLHELPLPPGRYRALAVEAKRLWWLDGQGPAALRSLALEPGANADTHSERVRRYALSGNGKTLLIQREGAPGAAPDLLLLDAAPKPPADLAKATVRWSDWQIAVSPREEWAQMFHDAWRLQRDHFYDAGMHGIDWVASRKRHEPLLERVGDRSELAELMAQMVSDLSLLHSQVSSGDLPPLAEAPPPVAGLGALLEAANGGARIARLYRVETELVSERGPLLATGMEIAEGDVITAINGRSFSWPQGSQLLQGEAGKQLRLTIKKLDGRTIERIVVAHDAVRENALRYQDWRTRRAEAVARASGGRVGYLHFRAMGPNDIADFAREFYAQLDKEALILDVRFNNGGNIDSWILERLLRRPWAWWQPRHPAGSPAYPNMQHSFGGPLAMLINEQSYSDGETIAEGFKRLKLGSLIGKATSGAGVWLSDTNRLIDGGIMRAAETGQVGAQGEWLVEARGVTPDIEVDNPPRASSAGQDAQLEAAVAHLLKQLPAQPQTQRGPRVQPYLRPR